MTLICGFVVQTANAAVPDDHHKTPAHRPPHGDRRGGHSAPRVTAGEAARKAQHANEGGRVLSVSHSSDGYRVKLIKNGEVRIVFIPAN